jgi:hypothetical protein
MSGRQTLKPGFSATCGGEGPGVCGFGRDERASCEPLAAINCQPPQLPPSNQTNTQPNPTQPGPHLRVEEVPVHGVVHPEDVPVRGHGGLLLAPAHVDGRHRGAELPRRAPDLLGAGGLGQGAGDDLKDAGVVAAEGVGGRWGWRGFDRVCWLGGRVCCQTLKSQMQSSC